jgi:hypothetical protein
LGVGHGTRAALESASYLAKIGNYCQLLYQ